MARKYEEPIKVHKIKQIKVTDSTVIRVMLEIYESGKQSVDIRQWYRTKADPEFKRAKGLKLNMDQLADMQDAINKAVRVAEKYDYDIGEISKAPVKKKRRSHR